MSSVGSSTSAPRQATPASKPKEYSGERSKIGNYLMAAGVLLAIFMYGGAMGSLGFTQMLPLSVIALTDHQWDDLTGLDPVLRKRKKKPDWVTAGQVGQYAAPLLICGIPFSLGKLKL